jgi:ribosomal protein L40E
MKRSRIAMLVEHPDDWTPDRLAERAANCVQTVLAGVQVTAYDGAEAPDNRHGWEDCVHCGAPVNPDDAYECGRCTGTVHAGCYDLPCPEDT